MEKSNVCSTRVKEYLILDHVLFFHCDRNSSKDSLISVVNNMNGRRKESEGIQIPSI